jgi:hypothetical protein
VSDERKVVAETTPAFCRKERRLKGMVMILINVDENKLRAASCEPRLLTTRGSKLTAQSLPSVNSF